MKTKDLFSDKSDLYSQSRPHYPVELFEFIQKTCPNRQRVWDCATGNGQAAVGLAGIFASVEATDISSEQILNRQEKPNIAYSISPAETTSFPDSSFDMVNVAQALHWFQFDKFWNEVSRVLKSDGLFLCTSYSWSFVSDEIDQITMDYIRKPIDKYWAPNNQLCWSNYQTIDFPFQKLQTPDLTIKNLWSSQQYIYYLHSWSATRRSIESEGTAFFDKASNYMKEAWGHEKREVRTPLNVICGYNWRQD